MGPLSKREPNSLGDGGGMGPLDKAAVSALTYKRRRAAQNCSLQPCGQENDPMHCSLATPPSDLFRDERENSAMQRALRPENQGNSQCY